MPIIETPKSEIYSSFRSPIKFTPSTYSLPNSPLVTPKLDNHDNIELSGILLKWTDYIKGYRKRWFVLNNGLLSYYSIKNKTAYACRGSINLINACVENEYFSTNFTIYDGNSQRLYLKAKNVFEKQKWLAAIEIAKNKLLHDDFDINFKADEYQKLIDDLKGKLNDLNQCYSLIEMNSNELEKLLDGLEKIKSNKKDLNNNHNSEDELVLNDNLYNVIHEKAKAFKISLNFMLNTVKNFTTLANKMGNEKENIMQIEFIKKKQLDDIFKKINRIQKTTENGLKKRRNLIKSLSADDNKIETQSNHINTKMVEEIKEDLVTNKPNTDKKISIEMLNKIHTESQLSDLLRRNSTNNPLLFKQNSLIDMKRASNLNDVILENDDENDNNYVDDDGDEEFQDAIQDFTIFNTVDFDNEFSSVNDSEERKQSDSTDTTTNKEADIVYKPKRERRKEIPQRPSSNINCIEFIKNCVGKSIDEIPIPFNFREPLTMLQRLVEEIEYTDLLDKASKCSNQWEQMAYVAAFSVSCYGTTQRTNKPFNSLLGETFEYDCTQDSGDGVGWKAIAEQISVNPPISALNIESVTHDWHLYHEFTMTSKFRLQYLQVIPNCTMHVVFKKTGHHYTWSKVNTYVHNIVVGKMWIENVGDIDIINHSTKDVCHMKYSPYNFFSTKSANKVNGVVTDANNIAHYVINGAWTDHVEAAVVLEPKVLTKQILLKTGTPAVLWKKKPISPHIKNMYNFSDFTIKLNEPDDDVAPTDSRNRQDQRLMELGMWDDAMKENLRIEEKHRNTIKCSNKPYEPLWFKKIDDPVTNEKIHVFNNKYWKNKQENNWNCVPNLF